MTRITHDFDHVVTLPDPGEPDWVREPDDDYQADDAWEEDGGEVVGRRDNC